MQDNSPNCSLRSDGISGNERHVCLVRAGVRTDPAGASFSCLDGARMTSSLPPRRFQDELSDDHPGVVAKSQTDGVLRNWKKESSRPREE